jgi:hypothetical protein
MASNSSGISADLERLGNGNPSGCVAPGIHREVISEGAATRTLLAEESGALCLFDTAAGVAYTLPAPVKGMTFDFGTKITGTGTYSITTNAGTVFLTGGVQIGSLTLLESADAFTANGSSHVSIVMDADTKGRIKGGGVVRFVGLSSTLWHVSGWLVGAGTLADPFV